MNALIVVIPLLLSFPPQRRTTTVGVMPDELKTTGAIALYVDPTGNDANDCRSPGTGACLTIQSAWNRVPKTIRHPVTIDVAAGTYSGAYLDRVEIETAETPSVGASIQIRGTLQNATLTTSTATGTLTAYSAYGSPTTFPVLTDSTKSWTVNDLKGRFVSITSGTGVGTVAVIISNTATTMTVAETGVVAASGSGYAIQDSATICNTGVGFPKTVGQALGTGTSTACLYINGAQSRTVRASDSLEISGFRFTMAGRAIAYAGGSSFSINQCQFRGTGTAAQISPLGQGSARWGVLKSSFTIPTSGTGIGGTGGTQMLVSNSFLSGGTSPIALSTGLGFASVFATVIECSATNCVGINNQGHGLDVQASIVNCTSAPSGSVGVAASGYFAIKTSGGSATAVLTSTINNCEKAVRIRGGSGLTIGSATTVSGTGNVYGVSAEVGANVIITSGYNIGATTGELLLDGAASTLAALRALPNKRITDSATGSTIFEE